jgi:CHC2 zinc finger/Toprim domain
MPLLFWDIETRSAIRLEKSGAMRYAADTSTEVMCIGFAIDNGDGKIWIPGQPVPPEFLEAAQNPDWLLVSHNDQFERAVETRLLHGRFGWPVIPLSQRRCTMAMSLASALPGKLDNVCAALGLPGKDPEGTRIMRLMCQPRRARKGEDRTILHWRDTPELREKLHRYCMRDVEIERALYHRLPPLSAAEQELWELDAAVNQRGFCVDIALAAAADKIVLATRAAITGELREITGGEITSINQTAKIGAFVRRHGHKLAGVTKRSVSAVLAHDPGDVVRRVLELRQEGGRASANKLESLFAGVDSDSRLRGTLKFHAASTGRWSGSRFQPQNLKKPETKDIDGAIAAVLTGDLAEVRKLGPPLTIVGDVQRGIICAAPGHRLIAGDFSAIESRVLAWLAGEKWKLETYRKYDETGDPKFEPYCVMASQALRREVTPADEIGRQLGKTYDLAFGFGGGTGAWRKFDSSDTYSDADIERFKNQFRRSHAATVRFWHALERAAHRCIAARPEVSSTSSDHRSPSIPGAPEVPAEASERTGELAKNSTGEHNPALADLIGSGDKICCPFHDDSTPSLQVYDDHFHCYGCGAHGDLIDWLMMIEGMDRKQAIEALDSWDGPKVKPRKVVDHTPNALRLWERAKPIAGTLAQKYLVETRGIDLAQLPANIDEVLRFHRCCPFNGHTYPCLLALMRNATTDAPTGIHRIALTPDAKKIERRMLGRAGAVKLWPATDRLVVGEGIETVLAAATRITHRGAPLRPAWSLLSGAGLTKLPIITGVENLIILVDNDKNGVGQHDAAMCADRWCRTGRRVVKLKPNRPGADFNDLIMEAK